MSLSIKETGGASGPERSAAVPGIVTLARWRVRQTWRLLLITSVVAALIVICPVALSVMIRVVSRPSIGQTLRLNAD